MVSYRAPGMDHDLYPYSALPTRPILRWPDGARVALWVVVFLEHWELDPPGSAVRDPRFIDPYGDFRPEYRSYAFREYGNRVGFFRILEALDRHGIRATVAANASACERYPFLVEECGNRGWEFAAHGTHATRMISSRLSEADERRVIETSADAVAHATGTRPRGWISQDFGESHRTPQLLAEAGFDHLAHWPNDDQPYVMTTDPELISVPYQSELDDVQLLWHRRTLTPRYPAIIEEAFSVLHEEGAGSGRSFGLGIHPWLFGMPHRIRYLNEALDKLVAFEGAWQASLGEIAAHARAEMTSSS